MIRSATFSPCRRYRYTLVRDWSAPLLPPSTRRTMAVIGLNPSTADETQDDPTIRRCIAFAQREDCNRLVMLNLWPLRSTDPAGLWVEVEAGFDTDALGHNLAFINEQAWNADVAVAAWSDFSKCPRRLRSVAEVFAAAVAERLVLDCLGTCKSGQPRHPLYLRRDTPLTTWEAP